ncbi:MAG TPA: cytochrome c oxidase subunit II [Gemmatimonadota bacterium]|nr:cytochrome c oxidase subunit II [Gemmatimonadota bacterium]
MNAERYEKAFLLLCGAVLVLFMGALAYATLGMGIRLPGRTGVVDPKTVLTTPPWNDPGLRQLGPDRYEAVILAQAWRYQPQEIDIPVGATVTFHVTSADVIHGFYIEGTRVNFMVLPGQITEETYTFDEPGEHRLICDEYCGAGHHLMSGKVVVR